MMGNSSTIPVSSCKQAPIPHQTQEQKREGPELNIVLRIQLRGITGLLEKRSIDHKLGYKQSYDLVVEPCHSGWLLQLCKIYHFVT
jgi:hypothetical protein